MTIVFDSKEPSMLKLGLRVLGVFFGGWLVASASFADDAKVGGRQVDTLQRDAKAESGVVIRLAGDQPAAGFRRMALESDSQMIYVSSAAGLSTADFMSVTEGPDRVALQLTPEAAGRFAPGTHDRLAIFVDGHLSSAPRATFSAESGVVELIGLLPGQSQRLSRILVSSPVGALGPRLQAVARESTVPVGEFATVDVFIRGVAELRAYQVTLDVSGGTTGNLESGELTVDIARDDYVFHGQQAVHAADLERGLALSALYAGAVAAQEQMYLATFQYKVLEGASGRFQIQVRTNGDTLLRDDHGLPVGYQTGAPATITVGHRFRPTDRQ